MKIMESDGTVVLTDITTEQLKRIRQLEKPLNTRPKLITRKQAAEILDCCTMTIKRLEKRGALTPIRFSARRVRLDEAQVLELARTGIQHREVTV
ncbi:MAG: hypothetical protein JEZ10_06310 [Verrucomicrobia bacterium]|nr:hypothetical protein [Verrucomicrobiota bacterium]